jgi:two-component system, NarL family, response regulator DevR
MPRQGSELIHLLLVDDHEVVRLGLRTLLRRAPRLQIVGEAGTAAAAVAEALRLKPDVVLMDLRLPDGSGIEACREIRTACPEARVLFLTSYSDDDAVRSTIFAGASGYLLKEVDGEALIRAIESVAEGRSILDSAVTSRVLEQIRSASHAAGAEMSEMLSPQEQRVLALVAEGKTNKEIAAALGLSDKTVKNYLSNIFHKLQVSRRSQAAALFVQNFPKDSHV